MFDFYAFGRFLYRWLFQLHWTLRRAAVSLGLLVLIPFEVVIHAALALDNVVYPGHRRETVSEPVFITGNPRSGTTFLHRILAKDRGRFSTMQMWEVLLAPSIIQRRLVRALARLDQAIGQPCAKAWRLVERRWAMDNIMHRVSLSAPEEDDYLLLHQWSALTVGLSSGLLEEAWPYTCFDTKLSEKKRRSLMRFHRRCIERHLYARGKAGQSTSYYLAKNPALCPKLDSVFEEFPDARIIYLVRNPLEVIPSYVSMMDFSWRAVGVTVSRAALADYVLKMAARWYLYPLNRLERAPAGQYCIVNYDELVRDPEGIVTEIYSRFGWRMEPEFADILRREAASAADYSSQHRYEISAFGLTSARIVEACREVFERFGFSTGDAALDSELHPVAVSAVCATDKRTVDAEGEP